MRPLIAQPVRAGARALAALLLTLPLGLLTALPASADTTKGCVATFAGQDVGKASSTDPNGAIQVQYDQAAPLKVTAPAALTGYNVDVEIAGGRFTAAKGATNGNTWGQDVPVKQYAIYGVGLYKVIGVSNGPGACEATALVNIVGKDPLSTPAGIAAAVILAIGALGTAAATLRGALGTPGDAGKYISDMRSIEQGTMPLSAAGPYVDPESGTMAFIDDWGLGRPEPAQQETAIIDDFGRYGAEPEVTGIADDWGRDPRVVEEDVTEIADDWGRGQRVPDEDVTGIADDFGVRDADPGSAPPGAPVHKPPPGGGRR